MRFSKKIVITMFVTVFAFVVTMILTYWFKGGVPDSLIEQFFGFFGIEGGALAIIKVGEAFLFCFCHAVYSLILRSILVTCALAAASEERQEPNE